MRAVFKREFKSYFSSPIGYIYLGVMFFFSSVAFVQMLNAHVSQIEYVFSQMFATAMMLIPLITMRLLSEEKRLKTDQLLFTNPVNISGVVIGKYLAAFLMYMIAISSTLVYIVIVSTFVSPNWNIFLGNYLGLALLGAALIAIGMFISALTESQVISGIMTFASVVLIMSIDTVMVKIPESMSWVSKVIGSLSFTTRYSDFITGILDIRHILFFVSIAAVFVFLTVRIIERRRWS